MAGDWFPVRHDLEEEPEVVRMASAICPQSVRDLNERMRAVTMVCGALQRTWRLFDKLTEDGNLEGYSGEWLDAHIGIEDWASHMASVGWLIVGTESLTMPGFETWLGRSAKRRLKDAQRKREARTKPSARSRTKYGQTADEKRTTEQDSTEENIPPSPSSTVQPTCVVDDVGGGGDGSSWKEVEKKIRETGVADVDGAIGSARSRGATPELVLDVLDHWERHPGQWNLGCLCWRIKNSHPDTAPADGWPKPDKSAEEQAAKERKRAERHNARMANGIIKRGRSAKKSDAEITAELKAAGLEWPE